MERVIDATGLTQRLRTVLEYRNQTGRKLKTAQTRSHRKRAERRACEISPILSALKHQTKTKNTYRQGQGSIARERAEYRLSLKSEMYQLGQLKNTKKAEGRQCGQTVTWSNPSDAYKKTY